MSTIRTNRSMNFAALGLVTASVAAFGWAFFSTPELPPNADLAAKTVKVDVNNAQPSEGGSDLDSAQQRQALIESDLWSRSLRGGFRIQPTQTATMDVESQPSPPPQPMVPYSSTTDLGLRLVGTVVEKGESMAIAIDRQGKLDFRKEGESFQLTPEGVTVQNVAVDSIRISYQGKDSTWKLGESLAMQSETMPTASISSSTVPSSTVPSTIVPADSTATPAMSIDEELDLLNGN